MRRVLTAAAILAATTLITGCSYRSVDPVTSGAEAVPGTGVLHRFCDQSTLIYVSIVPNESDNFEAFFAGWCSLDAATNTWLPAIGAPPPEQVAQQVPGGEDTNQQDERDEG